MRLSLDFIVTDNNFISKSYIYFCIDIYLSYHAEAVFWPVFIVATFASVMGNQAVISATLSLMRKCCALNYFPRVKIISHPYYIQISYMGSVI